VKVRTLIKKMYEAIIRGDVIRQSKLYKKITEKSLKNKKTQAVQ
jgi:hypothetical protein